MAKFANMIKRVLKRAFWWLEAIWELGQKDWMLKLDQLYTDLHALGIRAEITQDDPTHKGFIRVISIAQSPIRWVKLTGVGQSDDFEWIIEYWIPDSRHLPGLEISSYRAGDDVRWEGDNKDTGIAESLSNDRAIVNAILNAGDSFKVKTSPKNNYWIISDPINPIWWHRPVLRLDQWDCCEKIAAFLLATAISV